MHAVVAYMARQVVPISWDLRGRIIRSLIQESGDQQIDTIDGIKVFYDDIWILMHSSSEERVINLYAEAPNREKADHLIQEYAEKIRGLIKWSISNR